MTADELRARVTVIQEDPDAFTDDVIDDLIEEFEDIAERYRGVSYIARTTTETVEVDRCKRHVLEHVKVTAISSITVEGIAVTEYTFRDGFSVVFDGEQTGTLAVAYTHGFTSPPVAVLRACREYVRSNATADRSRVPRDVISQSGDGFTTRYSTPSWDQGRPTGWVAVDTILNSLTDYRAPGVG
jgi:hypothetical protein